LVGLTDLTGRCCADHSVNITAIIVAKGKHTEAVPREITLYSGGGVPERDMETAENVASDIYKRNRGGCIRTHVVRRHKVGVVTK
jgi:hypothetical protein